MTLATSLRKTASKLMGEFGGTATIRRVITGTYNPAAGTVSEATSDTAVRGVLQWEPTDRLTLLEQRVAALESA